MTIIGMNVGVGGTRALVWADTQTFVRDQAVGHVCKIGVNALSCASGAGTGDVWALVAARNVLTSAVTFDEAVARIPNALRQATLRRLVRVGKSAALGPLYFDDTAFVAAGFSHRAGRLVGYHFSWSTFFEPEPQRAICLPDPESLDIGDVETVEEISHLAVEQFRLFKISMPAAGAGAVVVAELCLDGTVRATPVLDLATGRRLTRPISVAQLAASAGTPGPASCPPADGCLAGPPLADS